MCAWYVLPSRARSAAAHQQLVGTGVVAMCLCVRERVKAMVAQESRREEVCDTPNITRRQPHGGAGGGGRAGRAGHGLVLGYNRRGAQAL
jgi:hypothetical protein